MIALSNCFVILYLKFQTVIEFHCKLKFKYQNLIILSALNKLVLLVYCKKTRTCEVQNELVAHKFFTAHLHILLSSPYNGKQRE